MATICPFCNTSVPKVINKTSHGTIHLTEYRCDKCQRTWAEGIRSPMPAPVPKNKSA